MSPGAESLVAKGGLEVVSGALFLGSRKVWTWSVQDTDVFPEPIYCFTCAEQPLTPVTLESLALY